LIGCFNHANQDSSISTCFLAGVISRRFQENMSAPFRAPHLISLRLREFFSAVKPVKN
jgi:hypothetical protein